MSPYAVMLRKDFRRLALPFAAWFVLLVASVYFNLTLPPADSGPRTLYGLWEIWKTLGILLYGIFTIFIAAAVVLEDPPRGTEAFWLTRPFSRGSILAAKLTLIGVLTLFPLVVAAISLALARVGPSDIALATLSVFLERSAFPLAAACAAATSESFGRFALTSILLLLGGVAVAMIAAAISFFAFAHAVPGIMGPHQVVTATMQASKTLAGQLFYLSAPLALLIWRYRQRHLRFFLGYVALCAVLCPVLPMIWRWDFLSNGVADQHVGAPMVRGVRFGVKVDSPLNSRTFAHVATFTAVNPQTNQEIVPLNFSEAWFLWPNGDRAEVTRSNLLTSLTAQQSGSAKLLNQAMAPVSILNPPERPFSSQFILNVTSPMARDRLQREPAVFYAHVEAAVMQCDVAGELPLLPGSRATVDGRNTSLVESSLSSPREYTATVQQGWLTGALATALHRPAESNRANPLFAIPMAQNFWSTPVYMLVNRVKGQALIGKSRSPQVTPLSGIGSYSIQTATLTFEGEVLDADWVKGATLVCLTYHRVGTAAATVESAPTNPL